MERIGSMAREFVELTLTYLSQPSILWQLIAVGVLFVPAWFLSSWIEPKLEQRVRGIQGMPGLMRILLAFLRRFEWVFYVLLLSLTYLVAELFRGAEQHYIIYSVMLLSGAWLLISVFSHAIRNRLLRRTFAIAAWAFVAATVLQITDDITAFLDGAGFSLGNVRLSILSVLQGALLVGVALWLSFSIGNFFDRRIQNIDELTPSLRVLFGKITRIALIILAVVIAISGLGIDLTALTVLSGAVGVGIGFGLQKVVSNFISGIIILLDQSIKPGDTISLGETFGWIRELRARFVSVVTRDGREFLIPNEDFITREVINWSFSDSFVRLDVDFGVAYSSDPHEVTRLAIEAASTVDRVDSETTPPVCWMTAFGDSSLDFKLRFWIDDPQQGLTNIRGKVLLALWDTFKAHGIGIPFPHREVIFKTPIRVESG